ncbi:MAG: porin family protein, partial [Prevotella sp.]|nr:porin family protein [Prevotella sp.]
MKKEDWTQRLRDRLADHREPVDDDLWERIEASLPPSTQRKNRIIPIMRWTAAASLLALALGGGYVIW